MKILVFNPGSSSLKFKIIDMPKEKIISEGIIDGIGFPICKLIIDGKEKTQKISTHEQAIKVLLSVLNLQDIKAVGYRVVHGGEYYKKTTFVNEEVLKKIDELKELAPLHNPPALACVKISQEKLKGIKHFAVFDTAFHQTLPEKAYLYAIPKKYYEKYKIRKYGFHGISHKYVLLEAQKILNKKNVNLITCHLGHGSSICAIKNNSSIETSMGFTPLPGLIMGERSGDIDPSIIEFLSKKENLTVSQVVKILNKESGLKGISGLKDMRTIYEKSTKGDLSCQLAIEMFVYRLVQYIGSYVAILGKVDGIVFTGGIGEGAFFVREKVANYLNIKLNKKKNAAGKGIVSDKSKLKILVIPTNEELMIAREIS